MSSCTSNSKFYVRLLLIVALFLSMYFVVGFALDFIVQRRTNKSRFTQRGTSKLTHLKLNHKVGELDIIFVGSSRTEYHMSQRSFRDNGMLVYNLGVSGAKLSSYASTLKGALGRKPKSVVLSLSVQTLYEESWDFPITIDWFSLKAVLESGANLRDGLNAIAHLAEGTNKIRVYADGVSSRVKKSYDRFEPRKKISKKAEEKKPAPLFDERECRIIQNSKKGKGKATLKCSNGDSILMGGGFDESKIAEKTVLKNLNPSKMKYLNQLHAFAKAQGSELIFVLEPTYKTEFLYDLSEIKSVLKAPLFDNTGLYRGNKDIWFDQGHLNYSGKKRYSEHLAGQLKSSLGQ